MPIVSESCGAAALFNDSSAIRCDIDTDCWEDKAVGRLIELCDDGNLYRDVAKRSYDIASLNTWDGVAKKYWKVLAHGE